MKRSQRLISALRLQCLQPWLNTESFSKVRLSAFNSQISQRARFGAFRTFRSFSDGFNLTQIWRKAVRKQWSSWILVCVLLLGGRQMPFPIVAGQELIVCSHIRVPGEAVGAGSQVSGGLWCKRSPFYHIFPTLQNFVDVNAILLDLFFPPFHLQGLLSWRFRSCPFPIHWDMEGISLLACLILAFRVHVLMRP